MLEAKYSEYYLNFKEASKTSREVLLKKQTWFIAIEDNTNPGVVGEGECSIFRGLSAEDNPNYEKMLEWACNNINMIANSNEDKSKEYFDFLKDYSSIIFGIETAMRDLQNGGKGIIFPSDFTHGKGEIEINGLIWMGDKQSMQKRIEEKIKKHFHCIKLKIGAIDFDSEIELIESIRKKYSSNDIEIRVDANGAFSFNDLSETMSKLERLSKYDLHSIEQPIRQGHWKEMSKLCSNTPLPIALDEELIGINDLAKKEEMLSLIKPQYIILKPALAGGFKGSEEWIDIAEKNNISWWITSALESNVGLSAIAQWAFTFNNPMPQGLGTGELFTNNIPSNIKLEGSKLKFIC